MAKLIFECEVDMEGSEKIERVELDLLREDGVVSSMTFQFRRPQRVRDGKHLRINQRTCFVVAAGEIPTDLEDGVWAECRGCGQDIEHNEGTWEHMGTYPNGCVPYPK